MNRDRKILTSENGVSKILTNEIEFNLQFLIFRQPKMYCTKSRSVDVGEGECSLGGRSISWRTPDDNGPAVQHLLHHAPEHNRHTDEGTGHRMRRREEYSLIGHGSRSTLMYSLGSGSVLTSSQPGCQDYIK